MVGSSRFESVLPVSRKCIDPIEGHRIAKPRRIDCEKKTARKDLRWLCKVEEIARQKSRTIHINTIVDRIYGNTTQTFKLDF